jgi:hypothetical protein
MSSNRSDTTGEVEEYQEEEEENEEEEELSQPLEGLTESMDPDYEPTQEEVSSKFKHCLFGLYCVCVRKKELCGELEVKI